MPEPKQVEKKKRGGNSNRAYIELRRRILELELAPGSDLDEKSLASKFGLSRTPLREALGRLASEQLVVISPNRGAIVAPLTLTDFPAFIETLAMVQGAVYEVAAIHRTNEDIATIEKAGALFEAGIAHGGLTAADENRNFHLALSRAAHNHHLSKFYERLLDESIRLAKVCFSYEADGRDAHLKVVISEHRTTIQAIVDKDSATAERLGYEHAKLFQKRIIEYLSRNISMDLQGTFCKSM